jgi:NADP-dependent alcohol dehydrogenase
MNSFDFYNPVKILFGEGKISEIGNEIPKHAKILMTYGSGSIKRNGIYNQVIKYLSGFKIIEFGGIEPNPKYETLMKAVDLCRQEKVDFLLAVGGGSVLDGTKFISAAIHFEGDPWKILVGGKDIKIEKAIPIGAVLTLAATGSEMNSGGVISKESTQEKFAFGSPLLFPKFSILDPTYTYSLPLTQISNGIIDAFIHVTEQYLTYPAQAYIQDRWAEGILQTLIEIGQQALANPMSYDVRANLMWSCTMALNGIIAVGVPTDWATHMIGHELTALFGLDHAVTLAIIFPRLLMETREEKRLKLLQFAQRIWKIEVGTEEMKINEAIEKTESFFRSLNVKSRLSDYGISQEQLIPIIQRFADRRWKLGENKSIDAERVQRILFASI